MKVVKLSINSPKEGLLRQTPSGNGIWGDYKFEINNDVDECDFWFVYSKGQKFDEESILAPENLVLLTGESEEIYHYSNRFVQQFPTVITSRSDLRATHLIKSHPAQPWWVGRKFGFNANEKRDFTMNFEDFKKQFPAKTKILSVISSDKSFTRGNNERIAFVRMLKAHFGDRLDVFGKGIKDFEDKWDILKDYKYHIVLENSSYDYYWTEKLADSYLAGCFPFYYGASNIREYFDESSFRLIDISDVELSISIIERSIRSDVYKYSLDSLSSARDNILYKYNIFPIMAKICDALDSSLPKKKVKIKSEMSFIDLYKIPMLTKRLYYKYLLRT